MSDELPEGWVETTLGELASSIQYGYTASAEAGRIGPRLLRITDIQAGTVNWANVPGCEISSEDLEKFKLAVGDIVFARSGATTGKSFLLRECPAESVFASYLIRVRASHDIVLPDLLIQYFGTPRYWSYIVDNLAGNAQPNCNGTKLAALTIPVPPLPEQRRIVAKIEALLAEVNRAKGRLERVSAIVKRFRQAVLAAACSGELTREWRLANPMSSELSVPDKRVAVEEEYSFVLPISWRWARLEEVADFVNGDRSKRYPNKEEYVPAGLPFINTGHIEPDGSLSLSQMNYITREKWQSLTGGKIQKGDLVYCLRGATLGKAALVEPFTEGAIASSLVIIRPNNNILAKYLYSFLVAPLGRDEIRKYDNGSAQPNLSAQSVAQYWVPLPPLAEQTEIVRRVEELFALADTIERRVKLALDRAEKLPQAILSKAFAGELVPTEAELARAEGRSYEPASVLLERIRQEREATGPNAKPARKRRNKSS